MWEDSSKQAILAMAGVENGLGDITGATEKAGEEINNSIGTKMESAIRKLKDNFAKLGQSLLPAIEGVSEGISKIADVIGNLDPKLVTSVAKFGALAIAIGGVGKVFGGFTSAIGTGMSALGGLINLCKDTKSLGSFAQALANVGTKATGSTGGVSSLLGIIGKITPTGGAIGLAIGAVTALGVAFYNNQKDIKEGEQEIKNMGNTLDDFTGRVRSNGSIIEEIFGKELSWNISDDYKQRLEESKAEVEDWAEYIKSIQGEIQEVLNSTEKSDYQKNAEIDELLGTGDKYTGVVNAETKAGYMSYLGDKGLSKEAISSYVDAWEDAYLQDVQNYNNNQDKIQALYESDIQKYGKLTKETEEEITKLKEENAELQTNIETTKYEDLDAMANKRLVETRERQEEENNIRSEGISSQLQAEREAVKEKYNLMREDADNRVWASEQEKQTTLNHISEMQTAEMNRTTFNQQQNLLRAEYDQEYADKYGLVVEDMVTENGHWATVIKDSNGEIVSSYFSTNEQMEQWANDMGYKYDTIETANGEMVAVVMDANDNIIGSVDNLANKYNLNCESINGALSKYQGTTSEKMAQVQRDLDAGIIKAEEYGMTDQEFLKVAQACFESGGDVKTLIDLLYRIPTERNTQVNVNVSDAIANLNYLKQVAEETNTKIAGVNSPGGMIAPDAYATGGIVDESGIATVNEAGWELVDTANSTASAYSLGRVAEGELAYLSANTKVTNHLTSTQQMRAEVNEQVNRAMSSVIGDMKREIIEALKSNSNSGNNYYDIDLNNPNFVNPNDAKTKLDELSKMILRTKK